MFYVKEKWFKHIKTINKTKKVFVLKNKMLRYITKNVFKVFGEGRKELKQVGEREWVSKVHLRYYKSIEYIGLTLDLKKKIFEEEKYFLYWYLYESKYNTKQNEEYISSNDRNSPPPQKKRNNFSFLSSLTPNICVFGCKCISLYLFSF